MISLTRIASLSLVSGTLICAPAAFANDYAPIDLGESPSITTDAQASSRSVTVPMFTTVMVALDDEISSETHQVGDPFTVTVVEDVVVDNVVVIEKGAFGRGEVTFATGNGSFGKEGIIGLSLRELQIGDKTIILDGRYREEGRGKDAVAAVTMYAVGLLSAFVRGKDSAIEAGRVLKAKTGEDFTHVVAVPSSSPKLTLPVFADAGDALPQTEPDQN